MDALTFQPARPAEELCGPARRAQGLRRLGLGMLLAFTLKGLVTTSLMVLALLQLTGV